MARTPIPYLIEPAAELTFESIYEDLVAFVWRTARRLGVEAAALDAVCEEVFVAVHDELAEFDRQESVKTWVFGILQHSVRRHHRRLAQRSASVRSGGEVGDASHRRVTDRTPYELVSTPQALRIAHDILESLSMEEREVFVLVELEQWSIVDAAIALDVDVSTASARLRAARKSFTQGARHIRIRDTLKSRDSWRLE